MKTTILFVVPHTESEETLNTLGAIFLSLARRTLRDKHHHLSFILLCSEENYVKLPEILHKIGREDYEITLPQEEFLALFSIFTSPSLRKKLRPLENTSEDNLKVDQIIFAESTPDDLDDANYHAHFDDCLKTLNDCLLLQENAHPLPMIRVTNYLSKNLLSLPPLSEMVCKKILYYREADKNYLPESDAQDFLQHIDKHTLPTHLTQEIFEQNRELAPALWKDMSSLLTSGNIKDAYQLFQTHPNDINLFNRYKYNPSETIEPTSLYHFIKTNPDLKDAIHTVLPLDNNQFILNQCLNACQSNIKDVNNFLQEIGKTEVILKKAFANNLDSNCDKFIRNIFAQADSNPAKPGLPSNLIHGKVIEETVIPARDKEQTDIKELKKYKEHENMKLIRSMHKLQPPLRNQSQSNLPKTTYSSSCNLPTQDNDFTQKILSEVQTILQKYIPTSRTAPRRKALHSELLSLFNRNISKDSLIGAILISKSEIRQEYWILSPHKNILGGSALFHRLDESLKVLGIEEATLTPNARGAYLESYRDFVNQDKNEFKNPGSEHKEASENLCSAQKIGTGNFNVECTTVQKEHLQPSAY